MCRQAATHTLPVDMASWGRQQYQLEPAMHHYMLLCYHHNATTNLTLSPFQCYHIPQHMPSHESLQQCLQFD